MAGETKTIRNRDIKVLTDVLPIRAELQRIEEQRDFQRSAMFSISAHLTGMPKAKGVHHGVDDLLARMSETESRYREKMDEYLNALKNAERILNSIESQQMRSFVSMMYLQGKSRAEVMETLGMTLWAYNNGRIAVEQAERMRDVVWHERYYCEENGRG